MLDERDRRRGRMLPTISRVTRTREFRIEQVREMTIIPVLPDDTISYLLARLDQAESPASLAMFTEDGVRFVSLMKEATHAAHR
jgi:hypothetical protein